jgi:integrase
MKTDELATLPPGGQLAPIGVQAQEYLRAANSENTLRAYRADFEGFTAWCKAHRLQPLPADPQSIALYITDIAATRKPSTITRKLASISVAHKAAGHASPTGNILVRETLKGIRRTVGTAPAQKAAVRAIHLRRAIRELPDNLQGKRDRALLLVGYAGAFRRSELVGLDASDVEFTIEGMKITLHRSKTDQEGQGTVKGIALDVGYEAVQERYAHTRGGRRTLTIRFLRRWTREKDSARRGSRVRIEA